MRAYILFDHQIFCHGVSQIGIFRLCRQRAISSNFNISKGKKYIDDYIRSIMPISDENALGYFYFYDYKDIENDYPIINGSLFISHIYYFREFDMKNELRFRNYSLLDFSHRTYEKIYLLNEFSNLVRMIFDIYIFDKFLIEMIRGNPRS